MWKSFIFLFLGQSTFRNPDIIIPLLPSLVFVWFYHISLLSLMRFLRRKKQEERKCPTGTWWGIKERCSTWWMMLQRRDDIPQDLSCNLFSPLISPLLHSALTGGDSETVCTTTLLFIFLLCPSAAHTYSFKIPVCVYACVCTCAPTAASSQVPRCIIYIHQLC